MVEIYVDGQNTPYHSVICVYSEERKHPKIMKVIEKNDDIREVELEALIRGIRVALSMTHINDEVIRVFSDREDLVREFNLTSYDGRINSVKEEINKSHNDIEVFWVKRNMNFAGKLLEKRLKILRRELEQSTKIPKRRYEWKIKK